MEKKLLFENVSSFGYLKNNGIYKKILKNVSFEIGESETLSIVSENKIAQEAIENILSENSKISNGKIIFMGKDFSDNSSKKLIEVISEKTFNNVSSLKPSLDFIMNPSVYVFDSELPPEF